ncbi:type 1 glutamine amidotransferase domain-containing protein [Streptomyces gilvosporeus]|uniref:DJ-1/PfpI domain-containing protein n=1 Tax=Streptomyces gilvosporeus TaxID=553510 RepID=A0A1V0TKW9_9ACTN|nr:type 1 glutamine amidotransferase domain-containing protein [Streptomyces gilvosporeus]ARF53585.1 hypothetical protein B1H19_04810 [Streptomyces gilvosporeus]
MRVLMPVPDRDFDVTEVAVPWRLLTDAGHDVVFATERAGTRPACDPRLLAAPDPQFARGPRVLSARGTADDDTHAFLVQDGNYLSARWPGDAYLFGRRFCEMLEAAERA